MHLVCKFVLYILDAILYLKIIQCIKNIENMKKSINIMRKKKKKKVSIIVTLRNHF